MSSYRILKILNHEKIVVFRFVWRLKNVVKSEVNKFISI